MKFDEAVALAEGFDYINNKWKKNENTYFHFTNEDNFVKIINSGKINGRRYAATTYTYDTMRIRQSKKILPKEICVVRSAMSPDNYNVELSGHTSDIKFIMDMDKIRTRYKVKSIAEFPIYYKSKAFRELAIARPKITKEFYTELYDIIKKSTMNPDELDKKLIKYKKENKPSPVTSTALRNMFYDYRNSFTVTANGENFKFRSFGKVERKPATGREGEERIQVEDSLPLSYVKEIMIPERLRYNKKIETVLQRAKQLVPKITWYDSENSIANQKKFSPEKAIKDAF